MTALGAAFGAKHLSTSSTMMLTGHHAKGYPAAVAHVSFGPFWGSIGLEHGLGFAYGGELPAFGFH